MKENGVEDAERTEQYNGRDGLSDVRSKGRLPMIHFESKGLKSKVIPMSTLKEWKKQIERDCPEGQMPIIFVKSNTAPWVAIMEADLFNDISKETTFDVLPLSFKKNEISTALIAFWNNVHLVEYLIGNPSMPVQFLVGILELSHTKLVALMGLTAIKLLLRTFPSVRTASEPDPQSHESV